jgi:hypothetical protein
MGLFVDLFNVPDHVCNDAIEGIYKALSDGHGHDKDGIWKPHESPLIRRLVELFTQRGLDRLAQVQQAVIDWQTGKNHKPSETPVVAPPGYVQKWTPDELALVRVYLESLPVDQWTLDDHMMAIDLVVQTYLPADHLQAEAEWLAVRAGLMGKVQANMAEASVKQADKILAAMPSTVAAAAQQFGMASGQRQMLDFARLRAAEHVVSLADGVRHKMRALIAEDLEQRLLGSLPPGTSSLQTKLVDAFADLNRDWRRIAVTEAGEAQLQGYIASVKPGTKVKRVEQYGGACAFCRSIDGRVMTVVDPAHPDKDGATQVWPGKNNVGRSASPRKRVGDQLVARDPHELWWVPAGLAHPHCRGRWVPVVTDDPGDDQAFGDWLRSTLA